MELKRGEVPTLDKREGLVAIVLDAPTAVESIGFVPVNGGATQLTLNRISPLHDLRVAKLPAGEYCLDFIEYDVVGMGNTEGVCFEVVEKVLRYPGHLVIERIEDMHLEHQARFHWEQRDEEFQRILAAKWPQLAESPPHPEEEDFVPPEPEKDVFEEPPADTQEASKDAPGGR